jgi:hypothetical protein
MRMITRLQDLYAALLTAVVAAAKHQYQDLYAALLTAVVAAAISRSVCRPADRRGGSSKAPISRSVCRPADRRGSSTKAPMIAAMVMGKTLEEDFQKEHKNSNGCTSSRSVCRDGHGENT